MPAILRPFPDVADHVVQTEAVGRKAADRRRLLATPLAAGKSEVAPVSPQILAPGIRRRRPGTRRVLPLGFRE